MLEVVTALAAEEEHSTSPHSRAASSARNAQGTPTQSVALASISTAQGTAGAQDTDEVQGKLRDSRGKPFLKLNRLSSSRPRKSDDLERKSDETEEINIEEKEASDVNSGDTEELDLETIQSTARQSTITPRTLNFEDEAGPSSPIQDVEPEEQFSKLMKFLLISLDQEGQGYKNLQKLKYPQIKELYDKVQESIKDSFKDFVPMDSEKEKQILKERDEKRLLTKRKAIISEEQPSKKVKLRTETVDELKNYLRIVDFEKNAQDRESLEGISMISELQVIDSPDGEYLIIHRENNHFRAFDTLWEILHVLDRQDLYHLYRVVDDYYEHIPPTGLGLMLLGDLNIIWETAESSDDDFWKDQEEWEIIRWRFHESSGVHTLEIEDGTMIHMLAERRYPLSRELMIRMLEHGMEVEDESETAITLIHLIECSLNEDDPSRQYQIDSDISYYVIPHGRSLSELTQEKHVPKVIAPNEPDIPLTEDTEGPSDLINTEGTHEQNIQNEQIITQPTEGPSWNNTKVLVSINESVVPNDP
ncbi:hypothetical protein Tco_0635625 [Tanacetum coccineum]